MDVIKLASFEFDTERVEKSLKELSDRIVDLQRKQRENVEQNKALQKEYDVVAQTMSVLAKENRQASDEYKTLGVRLSEIDKKQKELADTGHKLQDTTARVRGEYKETAKIQNALRDGLGNLQGTTEAYEKALNKEIRTKAEAKANNSELIKLTDQLNLKKKDGIPLSKEQAEALVKLNEKIDQNTAFLKGNHSQMQKQQSNIGNYTDSIKGAIKDLGEFSLMINLSANPFTTLMALMTKGWAGVNVALKNATNSVKLLTKSAWGFIATPLGAVLAVKSAMKQSEETTDRVKNAFSGLTGILSIFKKAIKAVGDLIIDKVLWAFEKLTNIGEKVAGTLKKISTSALKFLGLKKTAEAIEQYSQKLARAIAELAGDERDLKKIQDEYRKRAEILKQTDYYSSACKYLGLIEIRKDSLTKQICCYLTNEGKRLFSLNIIDRQKEFVKLIISHYAFKQVLRTYLDNGDKPGKEAVIEIMRQSEIYNVKSRETYSRRASTITSWINWIIEQIEDE